MKAVVPQQGGQIERIFDLVSSFTSGRLFKISKCGPHFKGHFFPQSNLRISFDKKNWDGLHFGRFSYKLIRSPCPPATSAQLNLVKTVSVSNEANSLFFAIF
jgi:hypothetical protein